MARVIRKSPATIERLQHPIIGVLCTLIVVVGYAMFTKPTAIPAVHGQTAPASPYSSQSPHWSHIRVASLVRNLKYLGYGDTYAQAKAWVAGHLDMMETGMDTLALRYISHSTESADMKQLNPTITTYGYDFDLTMCQHMGCDNNGAVNTTASSLPENYYLHFSEDTHLKFVDLQGGTVAADVFIPGCPASGPISSACRIQEFMWADKRWPVNVTDTSWQQWYVTHALDETTHNSNNVADPIDGIFLDEHGIGYAFTHAIGTQTVVLSGGGIREYNGLRPQSLTTQNFTPNALDLAYTTDVNAWLVQLRTSMNAQGKFILPNTAEYFMDSLLVTENMAANGVYTELLHAPDHFRFGGSMYQQFLTQVAQLSANGGNTQLAFDPCTNEPNGYTAGNYPTPRDRFRMWNLASYYMAKESAGDPGKVWFDPNLCVDHTAPNPLSFEQEWLLAYEKDVGQPMDTPTVAVRGSVSCSGSKEYQIFARHYTNALVLVRVRDDYWCQDYGDSTAITVPLDQPMALLQPDGTLSTPITSVAIRNAEAVILFPAPDTTQPSTVVDLRTQ